MIKVAEWGTGMMGQGLLGYILDRPKDIDLCGVITADQGGADGQRAFHPGARHGRPASSRSPPLSARRASQGA